MKIKIEKAPHFRTQMIWCHNPDCRKLPECFEPMESYGSNYGGTPNIKEGTYIAVMTLGNGAFIREYIFCQDCIDLVYRDVKMTMDRSLWVLH